jgi:hypothetical protein
MHPRTPAAEPVVRVGHGERCVAGPHRDHSQEDGPARTSPAPDTRADRPLRGPVLRRRLPGRLTGHPQSSAPGGLNLPGTAGAHHVGSAAHAPAPPALARAGVPASPGATSGLMSMRQPVSFAASRAFWPSLPMASESW